MFDLRYLSDGKKILAYFITNLQTLVLYLTKKIKLNICEKNMLPQQMTTFYQLSSP